MKVYVQRLDHFFYYNVKMTADYCGVPVQTVLVDAAMAEDAAFKAKKGTGNFPLLELADGTILRESTAIAAFLARTAGNTDFLGATPFEEAQVDQWVSYTNSSIVPCFVKIAYHTFGFVDDKPGFSKASADVKACAKLLNERLKGKSWLVGDRLTLADIVAFNALIVPFAFVLDGGFRKAMSDVSAWFEKMSKLPVVARSAGYVKMHGAGAAPAQAKGGDAGKGGKKGGKAEQQPKKGKGGDKKKDEKKKETPAPAPAAAAAADEDDFDPFAEGGDDDGDLAEFEARMAEKAAAAKKTKKAVIAKSLVIWDVKGWDDTTDWETLAAKILAEVTMDGLVWKTEWKLEPIAFGLKKLQIGAVIEDDKVSTDVVAEKIMEFEDFVQSVDIAVFNKL